MKKGWRESKWQRIAKLRLGNGIKGNWYWKDKEKKKRRVCGNERETREHIWEMFELKEEGERLAREDRDVGRGRKRRNG